MIGVLDVHYRDDGGANAACVVAQAVTDAVPCHERVTRLASVAPYVPGRFYERELPCLLAVIRQVPVPVSAWLVDAYAYLAEGQPGLGARLHDALDARVPVVGVAKTRFLSAPAIEVLRGQSRSPLFVTAAGMDPAEAARWVQAMHGDARLPTLIRHVDRLCRLG